MEKYLGLPPDGSAHGPGIDNLISMVHWLMLVLFVGWGIFYIYTLIRFRRSNNPKANYHGVKSHVSNYVEVGVLIAEVLLLVVFSIPLWSKRVDAFPAEKDAVVVRIVAEQFAWNIHYPGSDGKFGKTAITLIDSDNPLGLDRSDPDAKDDITMLNQLNLPVNKPVIMHLTTKDVIHSLNFPPYRVKQDAIPGISIPVWFTPTKSTDEIREEMRSSFSIAEAMSRVSTLKLPEVTKTPLSRGMNLEKYIATQDYLDSTGSPILSKGDALSEDTINRLLDAGISEVNARHLSGLDMYISMAEHKDPAGTTTVGRDETLTEDAVSRLMAMGMKEVSARALSNVDVFVVMETYNDKSGTPIVSKGEALGEDVISKLSDAGIQQIVIAPATPTEIACAQLCGLGHYRMRGYMTVMQPEAYQLWYAEQEAAVREQYASSVESAETTESAPEQSGQEQKH